MFFYYIPFSAERPDTPVTACDILGIRIVQVPSQAAECILAGLEEHVKLAARLLLNPLHVTLHIELRVSRADDGELCVKKQRQRFIPLVAAGRMAETWVEEHKAVKVGIIRRKVSSVVHRVEVVHNGANLHLIPDTVLNNGTERVRRRALRQRELIVTVGHTLRANEDEVQSSFGEEMRKLHPGGARER